MGSQASRPQPSMTVAGTRDEKDLPKATWGSAPGARCQASPTSPWTTQATTWEAASCFPAEKSTREILAGEVGYYCWNTC